MAAGQQLTNLDAILPVGISSKRSLFGVFINMCGIIVPRFQDTIVERLPVNNALRIQLMLV